MKLTRRISYLLLLALTNACGDGMPSPPSSDANRSSGDASANVVEELAVPPSGYFDAVFSLHLDAIFGGKGLIEKKDKKHIFLNFAGASVTQGMNVGESFLLCDSKAVIPPAKLSAEDQRKVLYYVGEYFAKVDKSAVVALGASASKGHVVHIGGSPDSIACAPASIKMRAPVDSENLSANDIAFVFSESAANLDELVTQIELAIEAMIGLEAATSMAVAEEEIPGAKEINSMSRLLWEVDQAQVVDIKPIMTDLNELIPGGARYIDGFDRIITVTMGVGSKSSSSGSGTTGSSSAGGGLFSWMDSILGTVATPQTADLIGAVAVMSGHPEIAIATQILGPVLLGGKATDTPTKAGDNSKAKESRLPDYASFISVKQQVGIAKLLESMKKHHTYVNENYEDDTAEALEAMLVVAFSQSYRGIVAK